MRWRLSSTGAHLQERLILSGDLLLLLERALGAGRDVGDLKRGGGTRWGVGELRVSSEIQQSGGTSSLVTSKSESVTPWEGPTALRSALLAAPNREHKPRAGAGENPAKPVEPPPTSRGGVAAGKFGSFCARWSHNRPRTRQRAAGGHWAGRSRAFTQRRGKERVFREGGRGHGR
jgi:hypothetical protein